MLKWIFYYLYNLKLKNLFWLLIVVEIIVYDKIFVRNLYNLKRLLCDVNILN